ncbi:ABC transporter permease [Mobilicoccus pelagius]|uniref:ABC transporter permease protein n=1 Tax=Mobilicoccus pelagius NBRC 104925 TaxID=1089455 RepID=H5UTS1_9MICO|nr:ABC transporter permease [Mobilicoccus pelagius]GAB49129.1 hypothetical protein MOPEL_096_01370 [Mobilicoccus pelagius NBRC 104925]
MTRLPARRPAPTSRPTHSWRPPASWGERRRRRHKNTHPGEDGHVSASDTAREVLTDLTARPLRSLLTALGTLVGVAVLVGTLGLAASLDSQISSRFDDLAPRDVSVTTQAADKRGPLPGEGLPWHGEVKVLRIDGVVAAGDITELKPEREVRGSPVHEPGESASEAVATFAVSPGLFEAVGAQGRGVFPSSFHDDRGEAVAVLGREAAQRLHVTDPTRGPVVFVEGLPVVVIGIIDSVDRESALLSSLVVPEGFARRRLGLTTPDKMLVLTRAGAAASVSEQVAVALRPDAPQSLKAQVAPAPEGTRAAVSSDTQGLLLALAGVSLVVGGVGIANVTLVAVLQRTTEIGLRRAIGARRRDILAYFLLNSTLVGLFGAVLGTCLGALLTVVVAEIQGWPPTLDRWVLAAGPAAGGAIGLLAGIYPSLRAARIEPIDALRSGE